MSKSVHELALPLSLAEARSLCRTVVSERGWTVVTTDPDTLEAHEDQAHLHCHCPPATIELALGEAGAGATALKVTGKVSGFGPVSSKHAREQADLIARTIGLAAIGRSRAEREERHDG